MQPNTSPMTVELNARDILQGITLILNNQMLQESHEYLAKCEKNPLLAGLLLDIMDSFEGNPSVREAVFLYAANVIKRNWQGNRRSPNNSGLDSQKPILKARVLRYCIQRPPFLKWKHLKNLLGFLSHIEYPHNWAQLQEYMLLILQRVFEATALTERTIEDVELILKVLKSEANKSYFTKKNVFANYIIHLVKPIEAIAQSLDARLLNAGGIKPIALLELKLGSLLDRCRLSCLKTVDNDCVKEPEIANILKRVISKVRLYVSLFEEAGPEAKEMLAKSIKKVLLYSSLVQVHCPLLLSSFMGEHLQMLVSLLQVQGKFKDRMGDNEVCKAALLSLIRILRLPTYYADDETLTSTIMGRMLTESFRPIRAECRRQFLEFFTPQLIESLMSLLVTQVLGNKAVEGEDELEEEEATIVNEINSSQYSLASAALGYIMDRFKEVSAQLVGGLLNQLISTNFSAAQHLQNNIYLLLLVLPRVYRSAGELPMEHILRIMQHLHSQPRFHRMFALMATKYYPMLTDQQLQGLFDALIEVIVASHDQVAIFESSKSIKTILAEKLEVLNIQGMGRAILVIIGMFGKFRNPTAVALLVQLTNNVLDNLDFDQQVVSVVVGSSQVAQLLSSGEEVLVYHLCSFLEHLLARTEQEEVVILTLRFVRANLQRTLDNPQVVYGLWVSAMRSLQPGSPLLPDSLQLLQLYQQDLMEEHPSSLCELLQEYMLLGALSPTEDYVIGLVVNLWVEHGHEARIKNSALGLYLLWLELHPPPFPLSPKMTQLVFGTLRDISDRISAEMSSLQSTIVGIINAGIIGAGAAYVSLVDGVVGGRGWIELWLKSCRIVYTNESQKLTNLAVLLMLDFMDFQVLDQRFEMIVRASMAQLDPIQEPKLFLSKRIRVSRRKDNLRKSNPALALNLRPLFKQKMLQLMRKFNLDAQFVKDRIKSQEMLEQFDSLIS